MTTSYTAHWGATLLRVLRLYAEHEREGREAPTRLDAYAALNLRSESFSGARAALLLDGRLREDASRKRHGGGPDRPCTLTATGWAAIGLEPVAPTSRGPRVRRCLCCREDFPSWGAGNRLCPRCLSLAAHSGGAGLAW